MACANIGRAKKNATSACMWLSWSIEWIDGSRSTYSSTVIVEPKKVPNCTSVSWHWSYNLPIIQKKNSKWYVSEKRKFLFLNFCLASHNSIYQRVLNEIYPSLCKQRNVSVAPLIGIEWPRGLARREFPSNAVRISLCCGLD